MKRDRKHPGKLAFSRETLRHLNARQLAAVAGGGDTDENCDGEDHGAPCPISARGGRCWFHCIIDPEE